MKGKTEQKRNSGKLNWFVSYYEQRDEEIWIEGIPITTPINYKVALELHPDTLLKDIQSEVEFEIVIIDNKKWAKII